MDAALRIASCRSAAVLVAVLGCGSLDGELAVRTGCGRHATPIGEVQGPTGSSPLEGELVEVAGVVTLREPGVGFYLQSEAPDADPATSEGLFVRAARAEVSEGAKIALRGSVRELEGATELDGVELIQKCGTAALKPATVVLGDATDAERWEHMYVTARDTWTLVDSAEPGEVRVSRFGRSFAAGHELGSAARADALALWRLQLSGPAPSSAQPAPRLGSQTAALSGVVRLDARGPRLVVDRAPAWRQAEASAPRPAPREVVRIAALNVHNYFADAGARGAASESELVRQRTKLVAALSALHADVLGLVEVGNSPLSVEHLAAGLNEKRAPSERYVWSAVSPPPASPIRAALLYRADRVEAVGAAWFELAPVFTRPPLFQRFRRGQAELTIGVVHLKSKRCDGEPSASELEGCGADQRSAEAAALGNIKAALERQGSERLLLVGDFNADAREAPLAALVSAGFVRLLDVVPAADRYSYVFDGRATLLDHALASAALAREARAASIWHINADEPASRGYSLRNPPEHYAPDARRCSDHDPVSVDLTL